MRLYLCSLMHMLKVFLFHCCNISHSRHTSPRYTECMFHFENGPNIEVVPNVSEFFRSTTNMWDNNHVFYFSKSSSLVM
jgi:phosphatidate phosphatase APP1